jgi:hypothetical protein
LQHILSVGDTVHYTYEPDGLTEVNSLSQYVGQYASEETESSIKLFVSNNKLKLRLTADTQFFLLPTYADGFSGGGFTVFFERDENKKIKALKVSVGRARNILFIKK